MRGGHGVCERSAGRGAAAAAAASASPRHTLQRCPGTGPRAAVQGAHLQSAHERHPGQMHAGQQAGRFGVGRGHAQRPLRHLLNLSRDEARGVRGRERCERRWPQRLRPDPRPAGIVGCFAGPPQRPAPPHPTPNLVSIQLHCLGGGCQRPQGFGNHTERLHRHREALCHEQRRGSIGHGLGQAARGVRVAAQQCNVLSLRRRQRDLALSLLCLAKREGE